LCFCGPERGGERKDGLRANEIAKKSRDERIDKRAVGKAGYLRNRRYGRSVFWLHEARKEKKKGSTRRGRKAKEWGGRSLEHPSPDVIKKEKFVSTLKGPRPISEKKK